MARLPEPGSDQGTWGDVLNDYLSQAHTADGTLSPDSVGEAQLKLNAVTTAAIAPNAVTSTELANNSVTAAIIADGTITEAQLTSAVQNKLDAISVGIADGSVTVPKLALAIQTSLGKADSALQPSGVTGKLDVATASTTYVAISTKGISSGVASLDSSAKLPDAQLPARLSASTLDSSYGAVAGVSIEGYDIVILAGQSNMSGRGTAYSAVLDPVNLRVFQYKSKAPNANTIVAASEPLDMHDTPTGIGPGLQFARWYASRKLVGNRKVLLVPVAHGGTPLVSAAILGWRRGVTGGLYANLVAQASGALAAAGVGSRIVTMLWLQGETDGDASILGSDYQTDFDALINGIRTDLGIADLPIIIGTMVPEYLATGTRAQINAIHRETPARISRMDVAVSAVGMNNGDGNHFNAPGQRYNGKAMFDAYERLSEGIAPYSEAFRPSQVMGVLATSTSTTSLSVTWATATLATLYFVEYRLTSVGGAWTSAGTTSALSKSISGLTTSTSYDVQVTAQNLGASASPSVVVVGVAATPPVVLGVTAAPVLALSAARRVVGTYSGPLMKVRRSSDNTVLNIGMDGSGNLDTAALATFVGSGDGFVDTLYDQSANATHYSQATLTAQPKIVTAGTLITSGGKPSISPDGVDDCLYTTAPNVWNTGSATMLAVVKATLPTSASRWWVESLSTASSSQYSMVQPNNIDNKAYSILGSVSTSTAGQTHAIWNSAIHQASAVDTGATISQWIDSVADVTTWSYTRPTLSVDRGSLFGVIRSGSFAPAQGVFFSELVFFPGALNTTDRQTAEANQKSSYATP